MELVDVPEYVEPTEADTARVLDVVQNGDECDALHFACDYLARHSTDPFARRLIETAFARIDEPDGA